MGGDDTRHRPLLARQIIVIELSCIHVMKEAKDGVAYIGFGFGCTWDREHALGFMTHCGRVVEVGGFDTSFTWWIADRDARSPNAKPLP
jgi:hypothetical protein